MKQTSKVVVVGAGLTGPVMSIFLSKLGYNVELFEARPDSRKTDQYAGRSINLALSERGIHTLKTLALFENLKPYLIPMKGRMIHKLDGSTMFQTYSVFPHEFLYSVSRGMLNQKLLDGVEKHKNIQTHFDRRCTNYDIEKQQLHFDEKTIKADVVIAADGAFSAVRKSMESLPSFKCEEQFISYGYKELTIPGVNGKHQMETNALHIWPRKNFMLIALPNLDGSFTCTLFLSMQGEESFAHLDTPARAQRFFEAYFPDALPLIENFEEDFFKHPTGSLVTVKCSPWNIGGQAVLIGDAAHAITPFFGQGMNASFEDCLILHDEIEASKGDLAHAFTQFSSNRKKDGDAIADMAYENFIEMRDLVGDPKFQLKKAIENELERNFPEKYRSRYARVSFSRMPYSEVVQIGLKNDELLKKVMQEIQSPVDITVDKLKKYV
jgi:kynurenine 3-monooxygenase